MRFLNKVFLLGLLFFGGSVSADTVHYSIIVDAGSSGSRLHLFQYTNQNNYPVIVEKFTEETKPGLSSYTDHPENAGPSLKKLFDDVSLHLKKNQIDSTLVSVDVLATGGMRLLAEENQQAIYRQVTSYLNEHYTFPLHHVETITGKMEGVYDWLDVNYVEDTLGTEKQSWGAIDMGGASTQITFATDDTEKSEDEVTFKIDDQKYTLFSKSFLGLGLEQSRLSMKSDPSAGACFPTGYRVPQNKYHFEECSAAYQKVIEQYDVPSKLIPFNSIRFSVFSGAYFAYGFFGVEDASQSALEARVNTVCAMSWDDMKREYADSPFSESDLSTVCASGIFLDNLFYNTYHLTSSQMWVTDKSHQGKHIDWALGAMLYQLVQ